MEAAAALPAAAASPVYLLFPFECVIENGRPVFKHSSEPYYHEALDYRPASSYAVCSADKGGWVKSLMTTCQLMGLTSVRLVCKNGIANAAELTPAANTTFAKAARVDGDSVLVPLFKLWREADTPYGFHRLPEGWGLLPQPDGIEGAKSLEAFFAPKHIPVSGSPAEVMPQSVFLTLAEWKPAPHILVLVAFLTAAVFAGFGFSLYPASRLSPRRPVFWVWLAIACVGIGAALSTGDAIKEAFEQGPRDAAAIAEDQARLQSLFPRRDGHVEPFAKHDLDLTRDLQRPRTIANAAAVAAGAPMEAFLGLLPALIFLLVYARYIFAGYHYFFVSHPAQEVIKTGLRSGELFDLKKLALALREKRRDPDKVSLAQTRARTVNTQALHEQVQADAELADALMRRDRARAMQAEAEAELRNMRGKLSLWQRMFGA
jgi:hypothetical protein